MLDLTSQVLPDHDLGILKHSLMLAYDVDNGQLMVCMQIRPHIMIIALTFQLDTLPHFLLPRLEHNLNANKESCACGCQEYQTYK